MSIESQYCGVCDKECTNGSSICPVKLHDYDYLEYIEDILADKETWELNPLNPEYAKKHQEEPVLEEDLTDPYA